MKRLALISDIEMGGLKMLDIQSMISAKRVTCLKKLLENYSSPWKTILDKLLLPTGGRFVLHCNFQTYIIRNASMCGRRLIGKFQVVTKKSLAKLSGTTNFFVMTKNRCTEEIQ